MNRQSRIRSSAGAFLGIAFTAGLICLSGTAWGWVDMSRICHVGDTWYVTPSCDVERDCDTVQYAIDNAQPGETILLKRGIFDFGEPDMTDFPQASRHLTVGTENLTIKGQTYKYRWGPKKGEVLFWMTVIRGGGGPTIEMPGKMYGTVEEIWFYEPYWSAVRIGGMDFPNPGAGVVRNNRVTNPRELLVAFPDWNYYEFACGAIFLQRPNDGSYLIEGNLIEDNWWYKPTETGPNGTVWDPDLPWLPNRNALFMLNLQNSEVIIRNNRVRSFEGNGIQQFKGWNGTFFIEGNAIHLGVSEYSRYAGIEIQTGNVMSITNNKVVTSRGFSGSGLKLAGLWRSNQAFTVTGNSVWMGSGLSGIQLGNTDVGWRSGLNGAEVSDNSIRGSALYGYWVESGNVNYPVTLNAVEVGNLKCFNALEADIYCGSTSVENIFLVEDLSKLTVVDDGVDNVFTDLP